MDAVSQIIAFESGELEAPEVLELFADLIKSGQAWSLQGHYGRTAKSLIDNGFISADGIIDWEAFEEATC